VTNVSEGHRAHLILARGASNLKSVTTSEIDDYLARLDEPKRSTLQNLREKILELVPQAQEGMAYGVPAFRLNGKVVAGFAAFKQHLSYLPHSGSVFRELKDELDGFKTSKGALRFPVDVPLPMSLVERLVRIRIAQAWSEESNDAAMRSHYPSESVVEEE
jgi:uncharacterized protein YdhG (YjbR/CyaY superfamily)